MTIAVTAVSEQLGAKIVRAPDNESDHLAATGRRHRGWDDHFRSLKR
ncbi:hypothetical protein [Oricola thermophila]|uniref:Uncharacterized protein n=1 Tax=Oricola thermophila TaxID=2742145 RepID=A0A6N1VAD0_9HYPH|nr:hypothetical protein [Oricola thermophila]QKV17503.1 hypothetical protein HTY61_02960 [Oricola thermophila]